MNPAAVTTDSIQRRRYLTAMTRAQIEALPGKSSAVVIIPTGSVEQHGPHLPVGVDAILGQAWLAAALPLLPANAPVYIGPPLTFGQSGEHAGFPGTISLSNRSLHRLLKVMARQLHALGFRTLAVLNTHGGNSPAIVATLREIQTELGLNAGMFARTSKMKPSLSAQEAAHGVHAGQWETSLMLAIAPHLVRMREAVREYPAPWDAGGEGKSAGAAATYLWTSADVSRSGVMGDAAAATERDGRAWLASAAQSLADQIVALVAQVAKPGGAAAP